MNSPKPQQNFEESFQSFWLNFEKACQSAGRKINEVTLLPVSKGQSVSKIQEFLKIQNFPKCLGENYFEELQEKSQQIQNIEWHFLGALQSRKIPKLLKCTQVFQTLSREKELMLLKGSSAKFYIQVNISSENQKLGASFEEAKALLDLIHKENLEKLFVGFMGMASDVSHSDEKTVRSQFASLRKFRDVAYPRAKLSMGMSADYHDAIQEGSDLIRVGSLIFGERL
jgi:pyridoxal phosphate enzyme (YggS family)